ncbi:MAG TPA: BatD family protein [Flavitalea sp.]|nr:BatD family protein [Flavitalea sp.]
MKLHSRHIIFEFLLFLIAISANSQVSVKASVDREKILIGEPITLTLQAYTPLGQDVTWFRLDTIPGFEFIRKGKLDTIENVDNKKLEQTLMITSFDSGSVVFPPLELTVGNRVYLTDSLVIDVAYKDFDPAADYKDIKAIEEVEDTSTEYIPWIIGAVTLVCIGVIIWLLRKKKKAVPETETGVSKLTPYQEAMEALEKIKAYDFSEPGSTKTYYTRLNDILRVYMHRKLKISSLEKTNDELILQLKQTGISKEKFTQLAQALRMSDFVKFAKYLPEKSDNDTNWEVINNSIKTLNELAELNNP